MEIIRPTLIAIVAIVALVFAPLPIAPLPIAPLPIAPLPIAPLPTASCQELSTNGNLSRSNKSNSKPDTSGDFFDNTPIVSLKIELPDADADQLRQEPRRYVKCNVIENGGTRYSSVALKLKGAAGSFRELDDRPAFTLSANKFATDQRFHSLTKFHLNNSVQDETYLCEWLCADICRELKIPAARVTHARVWLNDRDLGLYVLKEGFDSTFLRRYFADAKGNLYDGGFLADVDAPLERDGGLGSAEHEDLRALKDACQMEEPHNRWQEIEKRLDIHAFIRFMAFELMSAHWDGYTANRNNYRIYFDPKSGKAHFFPHGMDQMFGAPDFPLLEYPPSIVGGAVMRRPEWRKQYRQTLLDMLPTFSASRLNDRLDHEMRRLKVPLEQMGQEVVDAHVEHLRDLKERIAARDANMREQVTLPDPAPAEFDANGLLTVNEWFPQQETEDAQLEELSVNESKNGETKDVKLLSISAGPSGQCIGSWRSRILLRKGTYRFSASLSTKGVEAIQDEKGSGAGIRISGESRDAGLTRSTAWRKLSYDFEVKDDVREVVLVVELRATRGSVRFRLPGVLEELSNHKGE